MINDNTLLSEASEVMLLVEDWGDSVGINDVDLVNKDSSLSESRGKKLSPGLYVEGIFLQADVVNRNRRYYPKSVLEKAVNDYIREQVNSKQSLGELNHPPRSHVDPDKAALIIEELWWEGSNVMGRAKIIEDDGGPGNKLAANIRAGWVPGVSSRGLGRVKSSGKGYDVVQEGFRLTVGVDAVWGPSAPDAWVKPFNITESETKQEYSEKESLHESKNMDGAFTKLISNLKHL